MAVALMVSEADNDQVLWCTAGIQTLGATAFDNQPTNIDLVIAFAWQTGKCIGLLGVTLEDITSDSPGDRDPSAGCNHQRAGAVVAAEEPLQGDTWMTTAGSLRPEGSDSTLGFGSCVGEPLLTTPPGYSLPPLPSFLDSLANKDGAISEIFPTDQWQLRLDSTLWNAKHVWSNWKPGHDIPHRSHDWDYLNLTDERPYAHPGDARSMMTFTHWLWRATRSDLYWQPWHTMHNPDDYSRDYNADYNAV